MRIAVRINDCHMTAATAAEIVKQEPAPKTNVPKVIITRPAPMKKRKGLVDHDNS